MTVLISKNPAKNFEEIGSVSVSSSAEVKKAVQKARSSFGSWGTLPVEKRVEYLTELYEAFDSRKDELSTLASTEMGFPIRDQKLFDIGDGLAYFKWYLENAPKILAPEITSENKSERHTVYYEPYGVVAVIQPWNFPFCQWSWSVVPNLLAGNTVVFKHSEECPLSGKLIEEIIHSTHLPDGVFTEVYGGAEVGKILLEQDINLISFTGSISTGKIIFEIACQKFIPVLLELGGSAPGIVFEDADLDSAIEHIAAVRFTNSGQACDGLKRLLVQESVLSEVSERLVNKVSSLKIGDPLDGSTDIGPLVAQRQKDLIQEQFQDAIDKGAKILYQGTPPSHLKGCFFGPVLLSNITTDMRVWKEEVFGPVLPIMTFKDEKEAVELANDTVYGLGGYIYSSDINRAERIAKELKTGMVSINGTNYVLPCNPFGGYKRSGIGRAHGHFGLRELCQKKVISRPV